MEYSDIHKGPSNRKIHGQISRDIGSCVHAKLPMLAPSYSQLSDVVADAGLIVYSTLSVRFPVLILCFFFWFFFLLFSGSLSVL